MKANTVLLLSIIAGFALALTGCNSDNDTPKSRTIALTGDEAEVSVSASNTAWKMLGLLNQQVNNDNLVFSPISANLCFSMVAGGACGDTQSEIISALGYDNLNANAVNGLNQKLSRDLCSLDGAVKVSLCNSFWHSQEIDIKPAYSESLVSYYNAENYTLNASTFIKDVNNWCSKKTNGMIGNYLSDNAAWADLIIANAAYFKGQWNKDYKFDKKETVQSDFHNADGTTAQCAFMNKNAHYTYNETEIMKLAYIPFGDGAYQFVIILPNQGFLVSECIANLEKGALVNHPEGNMPLALSLPKFSVEYEANLNEMAKLMGIQSLFTDKRDLSGISDAKIGEPYFKQKACINVDEEGAEAAAVSTGHFGDLANATPYFPFVCDRPFIFAISERSTGAILFIGVINKM